MAGLLFMVGTVVLAGAVAGPLGFFAAVIIWIGLAVME